jgi:hypothetical protein
MAAFVGVVIILIINNYRYLLPIQYIECDMMVSPLMTIKVLASGHIKPAITNYHYSTLKKQQHS